MSDDTSVPGLSGAVCCGSATAVNLPGFPAIGRTGEDAGMTRHGLMGEVARGWGGLGLIRIVCAGTCHAAELQRVLADREVLADLLGRIGERLCVPISLEVLGRERQRLIRAGVTALVDRPS